MAITLKKYLSKKGKNYPYLYVDQNGYFWVRKRIDGSTPKKKLDTNVESVAVSKILSAIAEMETEVKNRKSPDTQEVVGADKDMLFQDYIDLVVRKKEADGLRAATLVQTRGVIEHSIKPSLFWNMKPSEIKREHGLEFKEWHRKNRINKKSGKPVQIVNVIKPLGAALRLMLQQGVILPSQMPDLDLPLAEVRHHKSYKGRVCTPTEFKDILSNFDSRFILIPQLAYHLGNRKMELCALECHRVIKKGEQVYIDFSHEDTKTGIPRIVPVPQAFAEDLWQRKLKNKKYIFEAVYKTDQHVAGGLIDSYWGNAKRAAEIKGRLRFHDLRDTAATNMVKSGMNLIVVCTILGMSMKVLQEKYLKLTPEDLLKGLNTMLEYLQEAP